MRLLHPSLGLTALVAAFAIGLRSEEAIFGKSSQRRSSLPAFDRPEASGMVPLPSSRLPSKREPLSDPRLEELAHTLSLSHRQQAAIHPAIIRASFGYDPEKAHVLIEGEPARFLGPPLTRADFEDTLFAILDVEQQLDYAATATEKEAWWQSVISRLEADLESQTSPAAQLPLPLPPPVVPSQGRNRRLQLPPATD
jgi:hypothetical protein